jgi:hypothetical protein
VDLGELVQRVLLVRVEPDGRCSHAKNVARMCYILAQSRRRPMWS